jgi:hypothetical protein
MGQRHTVEAGLETKGDGESGVSCLSAGLMRLPVVLVHSCSAPFCMQRRTGLERTPALASQSQTWIFLEQQA